MSLQNLPVDKIKKILIENGVAFAAIFGSYAKNKATPKSDVDILVKFNVRERKSLFDIIGIKQELEELLNKNVDLVTFNALSKYIKNEVLHSMSPIYESE